MEKIKLLYESIPFEPNADIPTRVRTISAALRKVLHYQPGATSVSTTAEEALTLGKGVCQDFAHIMITLCRMNKIPARYANGFMQGEGFTHAWIEFYDRGAWYGFDPTHDRMIESAYITLARGRDYNDCSIDKGVFSGQAQQKLEVFLKVEIAEQ